MLGVRAHGADGNVERCARRNAGSLQCQPKSDGANELPFHRPNEIASGGEKAAETGERIVFEIGGHRSERIDASEIDSERTILANRDAIESDQRLGDHAFGR